jgi:hypothetical protein
LLFSQHHCEPSIRLLELRKLRQTGEDNPWSWDLIDSDLIPRLVIAITVLY